jgi:membrane protein YqaA with SNARE-associated domain
MKQTEVNPATERHRTAARWRNLWTALIFAIGAAATIFLITAILLFIKESWIPGAISTLASFLSGGAVQWLLARRKEAVAEEEQAFHEQTEATKHDEEKDRREQSRRALLGEGNSPKK